MMNFEKIQHTKNLRFFSMMKKGLFLGVFILLFASFVSAAGNLTITGATTSLSGNISQTVYGNFTLDNNGTAVLSNIVFDKTFLAGTKMNISSSAVEFNPLNYGSLNSTENPVIQFSIALSGTNAYAETYTGTINASSSSNPGNDDSFSYNLDVAQSPSLSIGSATVDVVSGHSASATFNLQNTGNTDLTVSLGKSSQNISGNNIGFNVTNPVVNYGETKPVNVTVSAAGVGAGSYTAYILASYSGITKNSTLTINVAAENPLLTVNDIPEATVVLGMSGKAKTGLYLKNDGNIDLNNIGFSHTDLINMANSSKTIPSNSVSINNGNSLNLAIGESQNVTIEITPSSWDAGTYKGNVTISYGTNSSTTKELKIKVREGAAYLEIPDKVYLGSTSDQERNETVKSSFTIKNTGSSGDQAVSDFKIYTDASSKYKINFSIDDSTYSKNVTGFTLNPGESKTIYYQGHIPADMDAGSTDIGNIYIYNDKDNKTISDFLINAKNMLRIKEIRAKVGSNSERTVSLSGDKKIEHTAYLGDKLIFKIIMDNLYSSDTDVYLDEVEVKITIIGIDDDRDLEEKTSRFRIRDGSNSGEKTLEFMVPFKVDRGTYDVKIEAEGIDEKHNSEHKDSEIIYLEVEKKEDRLRIMKANLSDDEIECNGVTMLNVLVANIGSNDQSRSVLTIKNSDLGIDYNSGEFTLLSDPYRDDNEFNKILSIDLRDKNVSAAIYPIEINLDYKGSIPADTETVYLTVKECKAEEKKGAEDETIVLEQEAEGITEEGGAVAQEVYTETTEESFMEGKGYMVLLVLGNLVIIVVAVLLVFKFFLAPKP